MSDPVEYPIDKLIDIAKIPEDRFEAFLEEFPAMVQLVRTGLTLEAAGVAKMQKMVWVDDGKTEKTIRIATDGKVSSG